MKRKRIVFFTGAGISAESGIKTFRDSDGTWENFKVEEVATVDGWRKDRQKVLDFYNARRAQLDTVEPNEAHRLIADLQADYDVVVVTQNVDDLHERGGAYNVIHLHGELRKMCSSLNKQDTLPYEGPIAVGDKHPDGSQLRPYIVWFGEQVPMMQIAYQEMMLADIFVVVGTSLQVYPAASLVEYVRPGTPIYLIDPGTCEIEMEHNEVTTIRKPAVAGMQDLITHLQKS